jgi:hypothetical protein
MIIPQETGRYKSYNGEVPQQHKPSENEGKTTRMARRAIDIHSLYKMLYVSIHGFAFCCLYPMHGIRLEKNAIPVTEAIN